MDSAYQFESIRTINTVDDIRDLGWVSGGFHDAFIAEKKESENSLYLLFDGTWGCKIEVWFEGDEPVTETVDNDVVSEVPMEMNADKKKDISSEVDEISTVVMEEDIIAVEYGVADVDAIAPGSVEIEETFQ